MPPEGGDPEKRKYSQESKQGLKSSENPHGTYEDVGYHHHQSKGIKSPSPTNGQRALDNSVEFSKTSSNRVGVDPVTKEFIEFFRTGKTDKFHGVKTTWDKLTSNQKLALYRAKLVRSIKKRDIS